METFSVWWRLARGEHAAMSFLAVVASAVISTGSFSTSYLFFALGPALIVLASFVLNDVMDLPSDAALGRKERPLVSKKISAKTALYLSVLLFFVGLLLCFLSSVLAFQIALAYSLLSVAYSFFLKKVALVGNAVVATTYAISFVYGSAVAVNSLDFGSWSPLVLSFAGFAFLAGLGRELLITLRDVKGDRKIGATTLPMLVGAKGTVLLSSVFFAASIALTLFGFGYAQNKLVYGLFVGACDLLLLSSVALSWKDSSPPALAKLRNYTLRAFQLALLGFFLLAGLALF